MLSVILQLKFLWLGMSIDMLLLLFVVEGPQNINYDIAVIVLYKDVVPNNKIEIASLPAENAICPPGKTMMISGWGIDPLRPTDPMIGSRIRPNLWAVMQECLSPSKCPLLSNTNKVTKRNTICVGDAENPSNNACIGDSGGKIYSNIFRLGNLIFF